MKKITLLVITLLVGVAAYSQSVKLVKIANPKLRIDLADKNMIKQPVAPTNGKAHQQGSTRDLTWVQLGSAGNGLTVLNNATNVVASNNALQTVTFVHRNDPSAFGETSSQYRFDVSTDGGVSWVNNIGPLNPNTDGSGEGGINGRYPQGTIFDPTASGIADSLYVAYLGTWHNGIATANANTWEGTITGVARVDGNAGTFTESDDSVNHGNVAIFTSMCNGKSGEFWSIAQVYDGNDNGAVAYNDSNWVVLKGVWNSELKDVEWSINHVINLPPELSYVDPTNGDSITFATDPLIAFDPTGMKGWICINGDFINDGVYVYQPVFFSTNDGGATWSEPTYIDLNTFDNVILNLDPNGSGIPSMAYEADLVVDHLGNPHYINMIGDGQDYGFQSGLAFYPYDLTYHNGNWEAVQLDPNPISAFRGDVGTGAGGVIYSEDNRCQASTSPDGSKVFFTWIDTDPDLVDTTVQDNEQYPNLYGIGLDVDSWLQTPIKNFTSNTDFDGKCQMPNLAPTSLRDAAGDASIVPVVIIEVNSNGSFESPADFVYFTNVTFNDSDFPVGINEVNNTASFSVSPNYPNPFSSSTQFTVTLDKASSVNVKVTNVLGETVWTNNYQFGSGSHLVSVNKNNLSSGVYFYTVSAGNKTISNKMTIE